MTAPLAFITGASSGIGRRLAAATASAAAGLAFRCIEEPSAWALPALERSGERLTLTATPLTLVAVRQGSTGRGRRIVLDLSAATWIRSGACCGSANPAWP